jgi:hypothetical protein
MNQEIEFAIFRRDGQISSEELKQRLEAAPGWNPAISLEIHQPAIDTRSVDPTFISAACTAGGVVVGALLGALGKVVESLGKQRISLEFEDGSRIDVEARNALRIIDELLPRLGRKTIVRI